MNQSLENELETKTCADMRYHKNVLYVTPQQQAKIKQAKILFAGVGLASVIAETALRLGFEQFIFIDGDSVELSNLNRQNYRHQDIGQLKVTAIEKRLKSINPNVTMSSHAVFLDSAQSIEQYVSECDIAVNAIDFDDHKTPFVFDQVCQQKAIPVVHPLNFGWAGAAYVVTPHSRQIYDVPRNDGRFELILIEHFLAHFNNDADLNLDWLERLLADYRQYSSLLSPPQLSVGAHLCSAMVTDILFHLINDMAVKTFPEPYFLSAR